MKMTKREENMDFLSVTAPLPSCNLDSSHFSPTMGLLNKTVDAGKPKSTRKQKFKELFKVVSAPHIFVVVNLVKYLWCCFKGCRCHWTRRRSAAHGVEEEIHIASCTTNQAHQTGERETGSPLDPCRRAENRELYGRDEVEHS